jgi:hypothetical protein
MIFFPKNYPLNPFLREDSPPPPSRPGIILPPLGNAPMTEVLTGCPNRRWGLHDPGTFSGATVKLPNLCRRSLLVHDWMAEIKEPGCLISRQPGCLLAHGETRGFPSPAHAGFGFVTMFVLYYTIDQYVKIFFNKLYSFLSLFNLMGFVGKILI